MVVQANWERIISGRMRAGRTAGSVIGVFNSGIICNWLIVCLRFRRRSPPLSRCEHADNADRIALGERQNITGADEAAGLFNALAVYPDAAFAHNRRRQRSGLEEAGAPKPGVQPLRAIVPVSQG